MTGTSRAKAWSKTPAHAKRNAEILRLWGQGKSAGQIAAALGITRSVVVGVVHRAGLQRSRVRKPLVPAASRPAPSHRPARPAKSKPRDHSGDVTRTVAAPPLAPVEPDIPAAPEVSAAAVPFLDRRFGQRVWPLWQAPTDARLVCGAAVAGDGPYCACHAARASRPPTGGERRLERLK